MRNRRQTRGSLTWCAPAKLGLRCSPGQCTKDPVTGELKGVWAEVARALAARVGVQLVLVEHPTPPKMVECLKVGACDLGFLGYDPARAAAVEGFSPPFIEFDYTYLVPAGSSIRSAADADRPRLRVAVVQAHASTLTGISSPSACRLFGPAARLARSRGSLRGEPPRGRRCEGQGRTSCLHQRVH